MASVVIAACVCLSVVCSCVSSSAVKPGHTTQRPVHPELSSNDAQRLKYFFYEAVNQQTKGNFDAAFDLLSHCLTIDPHAAEVYFMQAAYYSELDNDSMALVCMERAAKLNPASDTYLERLAAALANTKQTDKAIKAYEQLYSNDRKRSDVLAYLLNPLVNFVEHKMHVPTRALSIIVALLFVAIMVAAVIYFIVPPMIEQFQRLGEVTVKYLNQKSVNGDFAEMIRNWMVENQERIREFFRSPDFTEALKVSMPKLFAFIGKTANVKPCFAIFLRMRQNCYILYIFTGGSGAAQGEDGTEDEQAAAAPGVLEVLKHDPVDFELLPAALVVGKIVFVVVNGLQQYRTRLLF